MTDQPRMHPPSPDLGARTPLRVVRLGSKEAEELLQLDVTKLGRASFQSMQGENAAQTRQSAVDWAAEDLGPDEVCTKPPRSG